MSHLYKLLARPKNYPNPFLGDHLTTVSKNCQAIFSQVSSLMDTLDHLEMDFHDISILCKLIGGGHDVGKATKYFQEYIQRQKVDRSLRAHSPLSSFYVYNSYPTVLGESKSESDKLLRWLGLTIVLNHHGKLKSPIQTLVLGNWLKEGELQTQIDAIDEHAKNELNSVLQKIGLLVLPDFQETKRCFNDLKKDIPIVSKYCSKERGLAPYYLGNLIFSALIDADRMDAADVKLPLRREVNAEIVKRYVDQISKKYERRKSVDPERLHMRRCLFSEIAQKAKNVPLEKRIYSLTAPTGCGKTLAGLYFALVLRERLKTIRSTCPRIIYVAPFLSILDQNFEVFREAFGIPEEIKQTGILLQHHHLSELSYKVLQEAGAETYSSVESEILVEGWNAEIIVTTFVQFLYTILGARASQLRKLHNLVGSIVILDEVQCIPAKWWHLVRESMKFLTEKFKTYFILMTATQPLIFETGEVEELVENRDYHFRKKYVRLQPQLRKKMHIDKFIKKIIERIGDERSTMILMNTISSATYLYKALVNSPLSNIPIKYLSAELLPVHRRETLNSIDDKLRNSEPLVLVTTQVVEAGVNLDFDKVIRDMGPIDSIIQAAGRCNREGKKDPSKSLVEIFEICDDKGTFCRRIYGDFAIEKAHNAFKKWRAARDDFSKLAMQFYRETREGMSEEKSRKIRECLALLDYEKLEEFEVIKEAPSHSVFIEWDKKAKEVWREFKNLSFQKNHKQRHEKFLEIKKEFYDYVINVPEKFVKTIPREADFLYINHGRVNEFYTASTGFKRESTSSII